MFPPCLQLVAVLLFYYIEAYKGNGVLIPTDVEGVVLKLDLGFVRGIPIVRGTIIRPLRSRFETVEATTIPVADARSIRPRRAESAAADVATSEETWIAGSDGLIFSRHDIDNGGVSDGFIVGDDPLSCSARRRSVCIGPVMIKGDVGEAGELDDEKY